LTTVYTKLARTYVLRGNYVAAQKTARRVLDMQPGNHEALDVLESVAQQQAKESH
jgi:hypothetical protein